MDADGRAICGTPEWLAYKKLTVGQVLPMLTVEAAYALFRDEVVGSLRAGKLADLIILSGDPLGVAPEAIKGIEVWMTMVGGQVEYCAAGQEALCPGWWLVEDGRKATVVELLADPEEKMPNQPADSLLTDLQGCDVNTVPLE